MAGGFKISCTRTEYMNCNVSGHIKRAKTTMRIEAQKMPQRDSFLYLGSIISKYGEIHEEFEHRIKAVWLKWRLAYGLLECFVIGACQQD